ncbi:MAG: MBL fold metallo-hydrolase [Chloroflexota bacterium]|nr:MBL fold metallo-hydrolase [Chloroflexota bacterium]
MEVINGIHQIKVPFSKGITGCTNVYVVEGDKGSILIDSGWDSPESLWALREGLKAEHIKLQDIKTVVITHIHPDHYGLASKIKQLCGAKVAMHRVEAELINSRYKDFAELVKEVEKELAHNGTPQSELLDFTNASLWMKEFVTAESPDIILEDGDSLSTNSFKIEVIATPGHSLGHICLHEPKKRLLFSGDHVLYDTTPHIGFNPQSGDNPLGDYISSLQKLEDLKISFILPGHGPIFNSLWLRVEKILHYHEERKRKIMHILEGGLKTAYQIAQESTWKPIQGGIAFSNLACWDKRLAIMETIAHLKLLVAEGKVGNIDMNGLSLYVSKE